MTINQDHVRRHRGSSVARQPVAQIPFGPDREDHLISKALYVAHKAILAEQRPAYSDAREMMEILETRYPDSLWALRRTDNLKEAISLGFEPKAGQPIDDQELIDFIKLHASEGSRLDLLNPPNFD